MSKYRIRIEEGLSDVLDLTMRVEPDVMDVIVHDIYATLAQATDLQTVPLQPPNPKQEK